MESVLHPVVHQRLIADIDNICATANIPQAMIHRSAMDVLTPKELDWLRNVRFMQEQGRGLVLRGAADAETKIMAMTAAMLRNFIDARVIPLNTLLQQAEDKAVPTPSVLLIPNLYVRGVGRALPAWKVQIVYDLLLARMTAGKLTVAYVEDMDGLEKDYGQVFFAHLQSHYQIVGGA